MSEYQRFISYLYEYQKNEKTRNCGFTKVELRNHQCKLEVHMKLPAYPFAPVFSVYLFVPVDERLQGIYLGKADCLNGSIYGIFTIPDQNICGLQYDFHDLGGVLIQTDSGQIFATSWLDQPIKPANFFTGEPKNEAETDTREAPDLPELVPEKSAPREAAPEMSVPEKSASGEAVPEETLPEMANPGKAAPKMSVPGKSAPEESTLPESTSGEPFSRETADSSSEQPLVHAASVEMSETIPDDSQVNWKKIRASYPQCEPFFDDDIHQCVQLSLKDLPDLKNYSFHIACNPFMVHGCRSYGHILLGRFRDHSPEEYAVAVPGIYDENEQFLAGMFGFPDFKAARSSTMRAGQFGYWYRILH